MIHSKQFICVLHNNTHTTSAWTSYFPFSIFSSNQQHSSDVASTSIFYDSSTSTPYDSKYGSFGFDFHDNNNYDYDYLSAGNMGEAANGRGRAGASFQIDSRPIERAFNRIGGIDSMTKQLLIPIVRRLIMIINSFLGECKRYSFFSSNIWNKNFLFFENLLYSLNENFSLLLGRDKKFSILILIRCVLKIEIHADNCPCYNCLTTKTYEIHSLSLSFSQSLSLSLYIYMWWKWEDEIEN